MLHTGSLVLYLKRRSSKIGFIAESPNPVSPLFCSFRSKLVDVRQFAFRTWVQFPPLPHLRSFGTTVCTYTNKFGELTKKFWLCFHLFLKGSFYHEIYVFVCIQRFNFNLWIMYTPDPKYFIRKSLTYGFYMIKV